MGNQLCGCCRPGPALDEDLNGLLSPRKEYVPPTTCTVQRTVLRVSHPTSPRQPDGNVKHHREGTNSTPRNKIEEPRDEEVTSSSSTEVVPSAGEDRVHSPKQQHKQIHNRHHHAADKEEKDGEGHEHVHHERHHRIRSHHDSEGGGGSGRSLDSSNSSLLDSPTPSTDGDGWTTAMSPSSKKKSKRKAKYGRANYRADSTKRNVD
ncbi:hypothetical protein DYB25_001435 [Aphanomyces astaci]|uniref:Uncharacterized protein n=1 Tax=Aphanomyces astaci TaxID=112090 RepID=A0A397FA00_APHAT|nr:hypothetical protein AaE_005466 [Aphanomyces astaci]RHX99245.1 hypothetical protein DYB25_001435 [Aphanomyces astaci]RHY64884.1 hypothetical protein DYB34_001237 [Aphanomyces astaci]RHY64895.1 hypothetical protein DYB30_010262 [Aphanomyces astaci]RHZ20679.1 hypothetical protein DYB31_003059 [Aphanomyces astaci]